MNYVFHGDFAKSPILNHHMYKLKYFLKINVFLLKFLNYYLDLEIYKLFPFGVVIL